MFATKLTENIPDPRNDKEPYQLFLRKKKTKPVKQLKITTQQPEAIEIPKQGKKISQVVGPGKIPTSS